MLLQVQAVCKLWDSQLEIVHFWSLPLMEYFILLLPSRFLNLEELSETEWLPVDQAVIIPWFKFVFQGAI